MTYRIDGRTIFDRQDIYHRSGKEISSYRSRATSSDNLPARPLSLIERYKGGRLEGYEHHR